MEEKKEFTIDDLPMPTPDPEAAEEEPGLLGGLFDKIDDVIEKLEPKISWRKTVRKVLLWLTPLTTVSMISTYLFNASPPWIIALGGIGTWAAILSGPWKYIEFIIAAFMVACGAAAIGFAIPLIGIILGPMAFISVMSFAFLIVYACPGYLALKCYFKEKKEEKLNQK